MALPLPRFDAEPLERYPYGARSEAAIYVGELLSAESPALQPNGALEIVAIARRPGVLSKVAIRTRADLVAPYLLSQRAQPVDWQAPELAIVPALASIGADHLARISQQLDGERIQIVRWQRSAEAYIADALGLGEVPPMLLLAGLGHARVLLGNIDMRGIAGWRGLNAILASALTGWRIRLSSVAATAAWRRLEAAMAARRSVVATVLGRTPRGLRLELHGLYAILSHPSRDLSPGDEVDVRITRMDPDEGRIFASERTASAQPKLF